MTSSSGRQTQVQAGADAANDEGRSSLFIAVRKVIDQDIRPYVQADGGDIELVGVENNKVRVRLLGACVKCPSSLMTLRQGVEVRLQAKVSKDLVVEEAV